MRGPAGTRGGIAIVVPMHRAAATVLALLLVNTAHAQTIVWEKYDPMAVRADRTADVATEAFTTVSGVRLDYAIGASSKLHRRGGWPKAG